MRPAAALIIEFLRSSRERSRNACVSHPRREIPTWCERGHFRATKDTKVLHVTVGKQKFMRRRRLWKKYTLPRLTTHAPLRPRPRSPLSASGLAARLRELSEHRGAVSPSSHSLSLNSYLYSIGYR